jgi:iron complex transport system permease protein
MSATVRIGPLAVPVRVRAVIFCAVTAAVLVVVAVLSLTLGSAGIPLAELPSVLLGRAEGMAEFVFERLRGPRLATAIFAGALLGVSGALFQTVTRNPLGSPDVIGLGAGAGAGVAVTTLVVPVVPPVLGAAVATGLVFVSTGRGFRSPARTIIAGIAVAALAYAVTQYIVSTQLRDAASQLAEYLVGSLNVRNAQHVLVTGVGAAVLLPAAMALSRNVSLLEMGDETAAGVGVDPARTRTLAVCLSVLAAGVSVAGSGPIAFVALTAPQIARRVIGTSDVSVVPSALTGALILTVADLAAQQAPYVQDLPVGVLTLGVGGVYLGYLLVREHSKGRL